MTRQRLILAGLVGLLAVLTLLTAWSRWELGEVPGDYRPFELAATRFWAGTRLYRLGDDPFLSPPPFVFLLLPAHAIGPIGGHVFALISGLSASALGLVLVRRAMNDGPSVDALLGAALYLPIWLSAAIGQWGGFFFAVLAGVMFLASRKHGLAAGLLATVLCLKPTYAPFALAVVALGLGRRACIGLAMGFVVLFVASLPLGLSAWGQWRDELRYIDSVQALAGHAWQQHTLWGTTRELGMRVGWSPGVLRVIWLAVAVPLGLVTIHAAVRCVRGGDVARGFALVALGTIALNVYLRYYDSQIALMAALVLLGRPTRSTLLGAIALLYLALASLDAAYFQDGVSVPIEGLLVTAWLVLELRDALRSAPTSARGTASDPVLP